MTLDITITGRISFFIIKNFNNCVVWILVKGVKHHFVDVHNIMSFDYL